MFKYVLILLRLNQPQGEKGLSVASVVGQSREMEINLGLLHLTLRQLSRIVRAVLNIAQHINW